MRNKIILSTGALFHFSIEKIFYITKRASFDGLELILDENEGSTDVEKLKKYTIEYELPILSVHAPLDNCKVFGDESNNIILRTLEIAKSLGSKVVVFHPIREKNETYQNDLRSGIKSNQNNAIKMVVENMPKKMEGNKTFYDPEPLEDFFGDICLDTSHLATTKLDFKTKIESIINSVKHVHLADSNFVSEREDCFIDEHLPCSSGKLDLKWLAQKLNETGYKGMYCIELRPKIFKNLKLEETANELSKIVLVVKNLIA